MGYQISEVAARTGFSPPSLRYYEQIGLLPPPERDPSGYRVFTEDHLRLLEFIARAKRLGLPLEEIRGLAEAWSRGECRATRQQLVSLLEAKLTEVRHRVGDLMAFGQQLHQLHTDLCGRPAPARCGPGCGCDIEVPRVDPGAARELRVVTANSRSRR